MKFTDHLHPSPGAGLRRQPADPGARPARAGDAAGPAISARRRTPSSRSPRSITAPIRNVVAGFITTPLENAIAQANGIDYMTSTSPSGVSTITVYLRLNYDADKALTEINTKIRLGAEPAAHRHAAADADGEGRPDHRRHVYRLQQHGAGAEPDHRLPRARGAAEAAGGARRADGGNPRRQEFRAARLARSGQAGRLWPDRRPMCRRRWRRTTTSRASATPRARWCRWT